MNIDKLVIKITERSTKDFELFYTCVEKLVFATALSITKNVQDAEDITTETFIVVWNKANTFRGENAKGWVCAISRNLALNLIKKRSRETSLIDNFDYDDNSRFENNSNDRLMIESALKVLNDNEREIVLLHNSGLKHREIANVLDEKLGTVTWKYNNALKKMKEFLNGGKNEE